MRLRDKLAVITGGSDGIGLAIAEAFAREGASLLLVARGKDKLDAAREQLSGAVRAAVPADLGMREGIEAVVAAVDAIGEPVDALVNNAAVAHFTPFAEVTQEQFDGSFALNVGAAYFLTQRLLPRLVAAKGSVINISSYFAHKNIAKRPSSMYSLSKGALSSLTLSLAYELGGQGVRVNAIAPGTIDTAMRRKSIEKLPEEARENLQRYVDSHYPMGRIGRPEDVAGLAVYLASEESAWTSGSILAVDGGYTAG